MSIQSISEENGKPSLKWDIVAALGTGSGTYLLGEYSLPAGRWFLQASTTAYVASGTGISSWTVTIDVPGQGCTAGDNTNTADIGVYDPVNLYPMVQNTTQMVTFQETTFTAEVRMTFIGMSVLPAIDVVNVVDFAPSKQYSFFRAVGL